MVSHAAAERQTLADTLAAAGPDGPTLCEGWTTRDLAAHLVTRERRPDASAGIVIPPLSGWNERVRLGYVKRPYDELVDMFRSGPPRLSWASLPRADAILNLTEHFVHCEDVLRATPEWAPRELPAERQEALWRMVTARGSLLFRRSPVGVTLMDPSGRSKTVVDKQPGVVLKGEPAELVLVGFGRGTHARVEIEGPPDAVTLFKSTRLSV